MTFNGFIKITAGLAIICVMQNISAGALNVTPMVINADVAPGKKISGCIQLTNSGTREIMVEISKEMKIPFSSETAKNSGWLKLKQDKVLIMPGAKKNIDYSVTGGKNERGEAMAIIFFNEKAANASVMTRTGAVLYAKIRGTEVMDAEIENIKMVKDEAGQVTVDLLIHNKSNVFICPRGKLFINNSSGERVDDIDIPYNTLILPGQSRNIPLNLSKGRTYADKCSFEAIVDYSRDNNKLLARKKVPFVTD
jgi:hypothetical protein